MKQHDILVLRGRGRFVVYDLDLYITGAVQRVFRVPYGESDMVQCRPVSLARWGR